MLKMLHKLNVGLERYFPIKETASQSDKADWRYTGLKLVCFEQKLDKLSRYLEVRC